MDNTQSPFNKQTIDNYFYQLWFPRNTQDITIVAPPSFDELKDAELTSMNYALIDRLGDRDSIYAMGKLLSRKYPNATIHLISAEDFEKHGMTKNYVIIGGPGGKVYNEVTKKMDIEHGNEACRVFMKKINSRISYTDDCEKMTVDAITFESEYDEKKHMTVDYGSFAAIDNPYLKSARVIIIHGIHTMGVLGGIRIFDALIDSYTNFETLYTLLKQVENKGKNSFECFFKVEVTHGEVECPVLDATDIYFINNITPKKPGFIKTAKESNKNTAPDIKAQVIALLKIALGKATLTGHKKKLQGLLEKFEPWDTGDTGKLGKILEICNQNYLIPDQNIESITTIINNG